MLHPHFAKAQELGTPVVMHTGLPIFSGAGHKYGHPLCFDDVAPDFLELSSIQAHGRRGLGPDRAFSRTRPHGDVSLDVEGLPAHRLLECFPELEKNADEILGGNAPHLMDRSRLTTTS